MDSSGITHKAMKNEELNFSRIECFCDRSLLRMAICNNKQPQGYKYQESLQT